MAEPDLIQILPESVARRIAAGEVIERPGGVVRELLDNSLDAGADRVAVELDAGGIERIRITDNGSGMGADDLARAVLPHATSKIRSVDDLMHVRTLGFRGEALSSIAAVSRLEIVSATAAGDGHLLVVHGGKAQGPRQAAAAPGTSVEVGDLFYNVPARKKFLKRAASEAAVAKSVFLDKALPFPGVEFSLASGSSSISLTASDQVQRISQAYPERASPSLLHELSATGDGFQATIVAGEPTAPRKDRKNIQIFVNRRRIWEYALVQAVEYAYRDYLHGGLYPSAFLFLQIEPELVDFNIHPAKREARFRTLPDIHRRIVSALGNFLRVFDRRAIISGEPLPFAYDRPSSTTNPSSYRGPAHESPARGNENVSAPDAAGTGWPRSRTTNRGEVGFDITRTLSVDPPSARRFRYLGQLMNLFLVVELGEQLFLVDQHAAHERIIYDRLRQGGGGQELLFPVRLEIGPDESTTLEKSRETLSRLGIEVEARDGAWELITVPAVGNLEAEGVAALLMETLDRPSDFERELYASLSCRAAVMDGDVLTRETAESIIDGVIGLDNARCPHGRPVWVSWPLEELKRLVGRT